MDGRSGPMTARAHSLTERVIAPPGPAGDRWSMPATQVLGFLDALGRLGYSIDSLLDFSGVRQADLNDPDARVSCEALGKMMSLAQRERFTPNIGLELARLTPIGAFPLLDYLVATSETVGAGVEQLARHLRLIGNPTEIEAHQQGDRVRIEIAGNDSPFNVEYSASLMVLHFRAETDGRVAATSLHLRHTPDDVDGFARVLGCDVRVGEPWNGLIL